MNCGTTVVLAMSGGVDSSVAAHLLLEQGHDVVGVFMRHGEATSHASCHLESSPESLLPVITTSAARQGCCTAQDALDARRVADTLHIPFYALDLQSDFDRIIDYFAAEYTAGRTPNPCVMCNQWVKFGRLFDYADSVGAEFVATGHYARRATDAAGDVYLERGRDDDKDQSYALFGVARHFLPRILLPVGDFRKAEIRERAAAIGLKVAQKRDSQEICFVNPGEHAEFVRRYTGNVGAAGQIVTVDGQVVGEHSGIEGFTIGQRKGLGVAMGEPRYVVAIEAASRRVIIGRHADLARTQLTATRCNWHREPPSSPFPGLVQIRYNSDPQPATITPLDADRCQVEFAEPCFGVAPGQAAVVYDGRRVVGGGWIE